MGFICSGSSMERIPQILERLQRSRFRARFKLRKKEIAYLRDKGLETITQHAADFVDQRLAPAHPKNDGKQTPMRGHPIFIAQHATATCCRGCLAKWHGMPRGREMSRPEQEYVVSVLREWILRQWPLDQSPTLPGQQSLFG